MDSIFWTAISSNAAVASGMAAAILLLARTVALPRLEHALWLLVLLKLLTPPLVALEVPVPEWGSATAQWEVFEAGDVATEEKTASSAATVAAVPSARWPITAWLALTWILGSAVLAAVYARRSLCFSRIMANATPAPQSLTDMARAISAQMGMRRVPCILVVPRIVAPLLCWRRGKAAIVLPAQLLTRMNAEGVKAILAHELAHAKRRDHLVRLCELFAVCCFWWNPVVWIARRRLRECGEQCCDALVLSRTTTPARKYATALVDTLDWLAGRGVVPCGASAAAGDLHSLTRRLKMLHQHQVGRWAALAGICLAVVVVAGSGLSLAVAQQTDKPDQTSPPTRQDGDSRGRMIPPAGRDVPIGKMLSFEITETDADGKSNVLCSPKISAIKAARLVAKQGDRTIEVTADPIEDTNPEQWRVKMKLTEGKETLTEPVLIFVDFASIEIGGADGRKYSFRVKVE